MKCLVVEPLRFLIFLAHNNFAICCPRSVYKEIFANFVLRGIKYIAGVISLNEILLEIQPKLPQK
jgi:hypothetical protein